MATKRYTIDEVQPGMILAQSIDDDKGRVMAPEGTRLTPMYIKRLGKWGISEILIEEADDSTESAPATKPSVLESADAKDQEFMRRVAENAQRRFSNVSDSMLMNELKVLAVRHLVTEGRGAIPGLK